MTRLDQANTWTILGHLFLAIGTFGKPRSLRTDNAAVFRSRLFQAVLAVIGVRHEFTALAKLCNTADRAVLLTLKEQLDLIVPTDGAALQRFQFSL